MATRTPETSPTRPQAAEPGAPDQSTMQAALEKMRQRRAPSEVPEHRRNAETRVADAPRSPDRQPAGNGILTGRGQSDPADGPDNPEDDDFLSDLPDDSPSGDSLPGPSPAAPDDDDPVVFTLDDGTPVTRKAARDGFMMRQTFSAKTAEAAKFRTDAEAAISEAQKARESYAQRLNAAIEADKAAMPKLPDQSLKTTDFLGYQEQVADYVAAKERVDERTRELETVVNEHRAEAIKLHRAHVEKEQGLMIDKIPALRKVKGDPEKLGAAFRRYRQLGIKHFGFTEAEFDGLTDHRLMVLLDEALRGRHMRRKAGGNSGSAEPNVTIKGGGTGGSGSGYHRPAQTTGRKIEAAMGKLKEGHGMNDALAVLRLRREAKQTQGNRRS